MTVLAIGEAIQGAKDGFDLWYAFIIGLPALAGVFATLAVTLKGQQKARYRAASLEEKAEQTLYEIRNGHRTNLRDDLDDLKRLMMDGFKETRKDINGLREELRTERIERIEGDRILHAVREANG